MDRKRTNEGHQSSVEETPVVEDQQGVQRAREGWESRDVRRGSIRRVFMFQQAKSVYRALMIKSGHLITIYSDLVRYNRPPFTACDILLF